jgi:proline iminopeptidase
LHHRELFDPDRFRTILFDQRGAGRSRPHLRLEANTTRHLVEDLERIHAHLGIDRWLVVGGSWGSTLALAYAERFPEQVCGLVLRAIFLGTEQELDWAFVEGPKRFRPELLAELSDFLLPSERNDIIGCFMRRLSNPHPLIHAPAAALWYAAERVLSRSVPSDPTLAGNMPPSDIIPPTPTMQAHYFSNYCFLEPGQLLANAYRLARPSMSWLVRRAQ